MEYINKLDNSEKLYILKILKEGAEYTKNSNGYFFDTNSLSVDIKEKVTQCLYYITKNKDEMMKMEKNRNENIRVCESSVIESLKISSHRLEEEYNEKISVIHPGSLRLSISRCENTPPSKDPDTMISKYNEQKLMKIKNCRLYSLLYAKNKAQVMNMPIENNENTDSCTFEKLDSDVYYPSDTSVVDDDVSDYSDNHSNSHSHSCFEGSDKDDYNEQSINNDNVLEQITKMNFYRNILINRGYQFEKKSHDMLVVQEYVSEM